MAELAEGLSPFKSDTVKSAEKASVKAHSDLIALPQNLCVFSGKENTRRMKMNQEKQREAYEKMLKKCPDILTPMKANRWSPVGKNTIYTALKNGEIESYTYKGGYIFTKDAFIDYLVRTTKDSGRRYTIKGDEKC